MALIMVMFFMTLMQDDVGDVNDGEKRTTPKAAIVSPLLERL